MVNVITDITECCSNTGCSPRRKRGVYGILGAYVPNCTACSTLMLDEITKNNLLEQTIHNRLRKTQLDYSKEGFGRKRFCGSATASYETIDHVFLDHFDDVAVTPLEDHVPNLGGMWTVEAGTPYVDASYMVMDPIFRITVSNDFIIADGNLMFAMEFNAGFSSGMNILFNFQDNQNCWSLYHSPPYFVLFEASAGVSMQRGSYTGTYGYTSLNLTIRTNGDTVTIYKDGLEIINYYASNRSNKTATHFKVDWFRTSGFLKFHMISSTPL